MAYWQVRAKLDSKSFLETFKTENRWSLLKQEHIDNQTFTNIINSIQVDEILFLVDSNQDIKYYARCIENKFDGINILIDKWKELSVSIKALNSGNNIKTIIKFNSNDKIDELLKAIPETKNISKIKKLKIKNFRLFDKLEITFNENINVIIANNGAGKTTILDAISIGYGSMLSRFPTIKGINFKKTDLKFNLENKKEPYVGIAIQSTANIYWDKRDKRNQTKKTLKLIPNPYSTQELNNFVDSLVDKENDSIPYNMPLIMYYGTCRACFDTPMRKRSFQKSFNRFESLSGSLNSGVNFNRLFQWFNAMEDLERREIQEKRDFDYKNLELQEVRQAIESMLPKFKNPRIELSPPRFMIDWEQEDKSIKKLQIEQLSAGYKTVLAMIMDISARMSEANPHLGNKSEAIIMIDELDLHLHPKWQQTILSDLTRTFSNAQFIVTTHSPQILSTTKKEDIFILENGEIKKPFDTPYAKKSIVALEDIMNTNAMPPLEEVELLNTYLEKIHAGDIDSNTILELRKKLENSYGSDYQQLKIADMIINKHKALKLINND